MPHHARRALSIGAVAGLLAAAPGIAASPAATAIPRPAGPCAVATLPQPAGMYRTEAYATDPTGRFVAGGALRVTDEGTETFVLRWDRGRLTTIASPLGEGVVDVNAHGVLVGNGQADGRSQPWVYRHGAFVHLPTPSDNVFVSAVNSSGDIVGYGYDDLTNETFALRWPAARPGTVETLDAPAGAMALDLTGNGSIVGTAAGPVDWTGWVRRPNGRYATLTVPGARSTQVGAAGGRWAVGWVELPDGDQFPVRWNLRTGAYTELDRQVLVLDDINARGVAVGVDRVVRGTTSRLLPKPEGARGVAGRAIADDGSVVGFSNAAGRVTAVRWTGC